MSADLEAIVRDRVAQVVDDVEPQDLDLTTDLAHEYGLTSLNKVLLLTSVCDDAEVALSHFTEHDVAAMRSAADVVAALAAHSRQGAKA
ncbi:acyl carrier protein [Micromonospora sp. LOL_024]|uniref:acyl carrier protein n=1 Tax=Micromonospora sp. LOL_024 TaxID=3345412 RepID=UPI003A88D21B